MHIINLRNVKNEYKVIFIPGHCLMDEKSAGTVRDYVRNGGTVVMTAYSAKVNEHAQVFDVPMPGLLSDVFGIRANALKGRTPMWETPMRAAWKNVIWVI